MIQHQFDPQANVVPDPASGATELAFAARNLSVRYYGITVFDDVSFSVEPGAVVAVLGRNGAGKTTLLNCLLGLTVPDSGEAEVGGVRSDALTDAVRERIGYVSQSPDVFDGMTVTESIELIGQFYAGWSPEYARDLCVRLDLPPDVRAQTLSKGARQRLAIVQALAHQPDLLVLDEPVASLDPLARRDFMRILFDHAEHLGRPVTTLLSSHLLEDVERIATHLLFIGQRQLQLYGTHDDITAYVRIVHSTQPMGPVTGPGGAILHAARLPGFRWRTVVDLRHLGANALPGGAAVSTPTLGDLFEAMNT